MELVVGIIVIVALVAWFSMRGGGDESAPSSPASKKKAFDGDANARKQLEKALPWMEPRWKRAFAEQESGELQEFDRWYFDEPSDRQWKYLSSHGVTQAPNTLTKGQVSDIIGLFELPDEDDVAIIRFFKQPTRGLSQTRARDLRAQLMSKRENREAWRTRPPTAMQKEFYRFFDRPLPKGATAEELEDDINTKLEEMGDAPTDEWYGFETLYDDLTEPEMMRDMEIKKISLKMYRDIIAKKRAAGAKLDDLDVYDLAEEILDEHPEMQRGG